MKPGTIKPRIRPKADGAAYVAPAEDSDIGAYLALDRLLRYALGEALTQKRATAARFIEAAILSLRDTSDLPKQ